MNILRILIVEDESLAALELTQHIISLGFKAFYTTSFENIENKIKEYEINLLLMDINLQSKIDGIELYQLMENKVDIVYLTAYKDSSTISRAVETEPLGYLIKPYNEDELNAILQIANHKVSKNFSEKIDIVDLGEDFYFNKRLEKLFYGSDFIKLSKNELKLLKILIKSNGIAVSFENIIEQIWEDEEASNSSLRMLVYRLRNKLKHKLIKNEFNYGLKL